MRIGAQLVAITFLASFEGVCGAEPAREVLILVSRDPADAWAVSEVDGILGVLRGAVPRVETFVEYMDWQPGISGKSYDAELAAYYRKKYTRRNFRVVFLADEVALAFMRRHRDALFPEAQAAFCGIANAPDPTPWLTGVLADENPTATYRLALRLQPDLRRLYIFDDAARGGAARKQRIEQDAPVEVRRVPLELLRADTAHALFAAVENLPPHTAVLTTRSGVAHRMQAELSARCPVPIYGSRVQTHLAGILGGALLDGDRQGAEAARLGLRLLAGEAAAKIPIVSDLPPRLVLDFGQMQRFAIPRVLLPPGAEVLNAPRHIWEERPNAARAISVTIVSLAGLALWLASALAEKRRSAGALKNSLSLLNATLESTADGVLAVDNEGKITGCNRRLIEIWRIPEALAIQREDEAIVAATLEQVKAPEAFRQRLRELRTTPEADSYDVIEFHDRRVFERRSRPQRLEGRIIGRVFTYGEITERLRAEETRSRLEAELAHTRKLEALGTLAGGIAHDFNNLLTAILGYTQFAHSSLPAGSPARADLEVVLGASERARELVQQILTFSRKRPLERRLTRLDGVLREAAGLLRASIPAGVDVRCAIEGEGGTVLADSSQVHQAILNLAANAVHALHGQPGAITLRLEPAGEPLLGACMCLTVSDSGHGMDAETVTRIFDPFFTTKKPGEGTGLGLAVVHGIMQSHEGSVAVESRLGEGTAFRLYFPIVAAPAAGEQETPAPVPSLRGERLLVVDDEVAVLRVAQQMLEQLGYRVAACSEPEGALELFRASAGNFDAVVSDLNMPKMTGIDLAIELRRIQPALPVVLITGCIGDGALEERAARLGLDQVVMKPFTLAALSAAVHRAIAHAAPPHAERSAAA